MANAHLIKYQPYIATILFIICFIFVSINFFQIKDITYEVYQQDYKNYVEIVQSQGLEHYGLNPPPLRPEFQAIIKLLNMMLYLFLGGLIYGNINRTNKK